MSAEKPKKFYSKLGCRECKRRKIKCDETKPSCQKCSRLFKECVYPKLGEKVLRVSKKFLAQNPELNEQGKEFVGVELARGGGNRGGSRVRSGSGSGTSAGGSTASGAGSGAGDNESTGRGSKGSKMTDRKAVGVSSPAVGVASPVVGGASPSVGGNLHGQLSQTPVEMTITMDPRLVPGSRPMPSHQLSPSRGGMTPPVQFQMQFTSSQSPYNSLPPGMVPSSAPTGPKIRAGAVPGAGTTARSENPHNVQGPPPIISAPPPGTQGPPTTQIPPPALFGPPPELSHPPQSIQKYKPTSSFILNSEKAPTSPVDFDMYFNKEDLNLLASDLNNLVGSIMVDSNFEYAEMESSDSLTSAGTNNTASAGDFEDMIPRNLSYTIIKCSDSEKFYLERFYNDFASIILPFNPYDDLLGYFNPARDILIYCASKEPFLLAAILAQGAKMAANSTKNPKHEEVYCHYLSKCLKLLGPAINNVPVRNKAVASKNLASNIESVLLTVLLLTSSNASNPKQNWRPHLKGAKDLLTKHAAHSDLKSSKILIFCKVWYNSFELLAALSSKKGGTLTSHHEIDLIMRQDEPESVRSLMELGLLSSSGFNYMTGFHHQMLPTITRLIKFLINSRKGIFNALENIRLISELFEWSRFRFFHEKVFISGNYIPPKGSLIERFKDGFINWMDLSHTSYCLAGIITVLTEGFGLNHDDKQVAPITKQLIGNIEFLRDGTIGMKEKSLMIQWPMLVAGLNCYEEWQKNLVQKFFRISESGSATFSINLIEKVWNRHNGSTDDSDVDIDTVTY